MRQGDGHFSLQIVFCDALHLGMDNNSSPIYRIEYSILNLVLHQGGKLD